MIASVQNREDNRDIFMKQVALVTSSNQNSIGVVIEDVKTTQSRTGWIYMNRCIIPGILG